MIELMVILLAVTILTIEFYVSRKTKTETVCKVWVQENGSNEWICVDKRK